MENDIVNKVKRIKEELNPFYPEPNTKPIRMFQCGVVTDNETTIYTTSIATCVGLAITAIDKDGLIHRIVTHNSYTGENITKKHEEAIEQYLRNLEPIEELKVIMCSMDSFIDFSALDEQEQEILERINNIFNFYKEKHPNFKVSFQRSWYVKILPNGDFEYAEPEMSEVYPQVFEEYVEEVKKRIG